MSYRIIKSSRTLKIDPKVRVFTLWLYMHRFINATALEVKPELLRLGLCSPVDNLAQLVKATSDQLAGDWFKSSSCHIFLFPKL